MRIAGTGCKRAGDKQHECNRVSTSGSRGATL
jgi:hypothetical protein